MGMKRRIRELFAILLMAGLMFGSPGMESQAAEDLVSDGPTEEDGSSPKASVEIIVHCRSYINEEQVEELVTNYPGPEVVTIDLNKLVEMIIGEDTGEYSYDGGIYRTGGFDEGELLDSSVIDPSAGVTTFYCTVCWRPASGYNIKIANRTDREIRFGETNIGSGMTDELTGVDEVLGRTSDELYQITLSIGSNIGSEYETYYNEDYLQYAGPADSESGEIILEQTDLTRILTISVDRNGDGEHTEDEKQVVQVGGSGVIPSDHIIDVNFQEEDRNFVGWNYVLTDSAESAENSAVGDPSVPMTADALGSYRCLQIDPVFTGTVQFRDSLDSGTNYGSSTGNLGTEVSFPDARKTGYTFLGWSENKDAVSPDEGCSPGDEKYTITGNKTLYAVWRKDAYVLTWDKNLPNTADDQTETKYYGDPIDLPEDPVRPGYVFLGWDGRDITFDEGILLKNGDEFDGTMPARDASMTAVWEPLEYHISYQDGDFVKEDLGTSEKYNASVTAADGLTKNGYKFREWLIQNAEGNHLGVVSAGAVFLMAYDEDIILKAQWDVAHTDISSGTYYLLPGHGYRLRLATVTSGDPSHYTSGIEFYVSKEGEYTFQ